MKDPHFKTCPAALCRMETWGQGDVKRQLGTGAGLIFKGSGFYITDYRSDSYKEGAPGGSTPPAADGGSKASEPAKPKADTPAPAPAPSAPKADSAKGSGTSGPA